MTWTFGTDTAAGAARGPATASTVEPLPGVDEVGGKGHGLLLLTRLGLPVPPGFVVGTSAWRRWRDWRADRAAASTLVLPDDLRAEVRAGLAGLEAATGRRLGGTAHPLVVSVRSGAAVSMPGMMSTVLDVGLTPDATRALAHETGDEGFAADCRARLEAGWAATVGRGPVPDDATAQVEQAVAAVLASWDTPRARTYRRLHGIDDDLGTAVTVQAMVFGNRDDRSGTAVAFSRDPSTGEPEPSGDLLLRHQGEDVVGGTARTRPLTDLATAAPEAWTDLLDALDVLERHHRDVVEVEVTVEQGRLWVLQVRRAVLVGRAAVRVAVDLADAGTTDRAEALRRVSLAQVRQAVTTARLDPAHPHDVLTRGTGASPGVATGRVALTADAAVRLATDGPVLLVRPETSPLDLHGLAAAAGVLTARGGAASHAAVVARSLARPAVVGASAVEVDEHAGVVRVGARVLAEGDVVAVDGSGGEVVVGLPHVTTGADDPYVRRLLAWAADVVPDATGLDGPDLLAAARTALDASTAG